MLKKYTTSRAYIAVAVIVLLVIVYQAGFAQNSQIDENQPIALIADDVVYDSETGILTARGNVEVYHGDRTLTADKITYDERTGRIEAKGDIVLRDPQGTTVFANVLDLDTELTDGIIRGAQSLIGDQAKIAAVEGRRFEERYNVLSKAVYSPCDVCSDDPVPLWRIRARRIIHDEDAKQIHYENAWLDVLGVPVFWAPYFRHPDPTVKRASGFLTPSFMQSSNYGFGLQTPYYQVIDDQSDLTITPFITTEEGALGILEYRRAFSPGTVFFRGSMTRTDFASEAEEENSFEGHLETNADFDGPSDFKLGWDASATSEDSYLRFFDFSRSDTLESEVYAERYKRNGFFDMRFVGFQSLRDRQSRKVPFSLPDMDSRHDIDLPSYGGALGVSASSRSLFRKNTTDDTRISLGIDWQSETILPSGLALKGFAEARGDYFIIRNDSAIGDTETFRLVPLAGIETRLPLIREDDGNSVHLIEPIAQAIIAPYGGNDAHEIVNEDSQVTEFDEINLFDRTRFSGLDALEEGPRLNIGIKYDFTAENLPSLSATGGRILRFRDSDEFSPQTGLSEQQSDWILGWQTNYQENFSLSHRMRLANDGSLNRNNVAGQLNYRRLNFSGQYTLLGADPSIDQEQDREEVSLSAGYRLSPKWRIRGAGRRDLDSGDFVRLSSGLTYANECCRVDFFLSRKFTKSVNVPPSTSIGFQVNLLTLGNPGSPNEAISAPE